MVSKPAGYDQGNMNMAAFRAALGIVKSKASKIKTLTKDIDTVFLAADANHQINISTVQRGSEEHECGLCIKWFA